MASEDEMFLGQMSLLSEEDLILINGNRDALDPGAGGCPIFFPLTISTIDLLKGATDYWSTTYNPYAINDNDQNDVGATGNNKKTTTSNDAGASKPK